MKATVITSYGDPDVLESTELPVPAPQPGQLRVRVAAAGVNPVDVSTRSGAARGAVGDTPFPLVLGWDVAGEVDAVGDGVERFAVGDRVIGMSLWFATHTGTYAEHVVLDEGAFAPAPEGIDDVHAATIPLNGLTAWSTLAVANVEPGERLLVLGAAGAVGGFIVQLAARRGIDVIGLGRANDRDTILGFGATEAIDDIRAAKDVTVAIDTARAGDLALTAMTHGRLLTIAGKPSSEKDGVTVKGVGVRTDPEALGELSRMAGAGELTLRLAETLPLGRAADAHRRLEAGGLRGRVMLQP